MFMRLYTAYHFGALQLQTNCTAILFHRTRVNWSWTCIIVDKLLDIMQHAQPNDTTQWRLLRMQEYYIAH